MKLKDKVVIVTGAGRGIGRATALAFAAEGARVAAVARTADEIRGVAQDIRRDGGQAVHVRTDITKPSQIETMMRKVEDKLGRVDVLVNNAGIAIFKPLLETSVQEWDRVMAVNLRGTFLCTKAVLPSMMKRKAGAIINIASQAGRKGYPEQSAYCASKHGMVGFTKVLALEARPYGIRVHLVNPGGVDTRLVREGRDDVDLSKYMRPEEIADVVVFLAKQEGIATIDEVVVRRWEATPWG